jgi:hypothetical protein
VQKLVRHKRVFQATELISPAVSQKTLVTRIGPRRDADYRDHRDAAGYGAEHKDWLAEEAVRSEPVSPRIPCYAGKLQGISRISAPNLPTAIGIMVQFKEVKGKFPKDRNREF